MSLRPRDEYTYWWNEAPITEVHEALHLLRPQWGDPFGEKTRYLSMRADPPELHIEWFADGDSGGASSGTYYLEIALTVVEQLQRDGFVQPLQVKGYGYSYPDPNKLIISRLGTLEIEEYLMRTEEEMRKLLIPGEHSKFSGIFESTGWGRVHSRFGGRLFFDFVTPMKEKVRVYPDTKEVKKLEPEKV